MKRILRGSLAAAAVVLAAGCASRSDLSRPQTQDNFGVSMAKQNLWREAMFRFRRAVEINPNDAMAHNNLAVAYEANGDFENARKEYLEALRLDRGNAYIQKNYSRYVEFLSRNKKRGTAAKTASTLSPTPGSAPVTKTGEQTLSPPDKPEATNTPKPGAPSNAVPPTDRPPQPQPTPLPTSPPGGAR